MRKGDADPGCSKRRHVQLTFRTNVEKAAAKSNQHRQPREDQRSCIEQRVANAIRPRQGAAKQQFVRNDWIIADDQNQDSTNDESRDYSDQWKQEFAK